MVFSSLTFLYVFLPGTLILYFAVPAKARNAVLLAASLLFYFYGEQLYLLLMLGEIGLSYAAGRLMERLAGEAPARKRLKKLVLAVFLTLSLGALALFKYADLFAGTVNSLWEAAAGQPLLKLLQLPLPIGISFYVFQSMSYGLDVYYGRYPAERSLLRLATYISSFPQLIAGPIVRYESVREALRERRVTPERFAAGAFRFSIGLGKKVLLADRLFALCEAAQAAGAPSAALAWTEALAYLLYVYFDFSGYSDMAIGLAGCLGFDLPENFRYPLVSGSIREFWRRWHISLGSWFRDYLYVPLGGSRRGLLRQLRNILIVWALTGLWHGASWNYMLWGLSVGVLLAAETLWRRLRAGKRASEGGGREGERESEGGAGRAEAGKCGLETRAGGGRVAARALRCAAVTVLMMLCFVWFRFPDGAGAAAQFGRMFGGAPLWSAETAYLLRGGAVLLGAGLLGATPLPGRLAGKIEGKLAEKLAGKREGKLEGELTGKREEKLAGKLEGKREGELTGKLEGKPAGTLALARALWMLLLLALSTAYLVDGSFSPFLYFRF